MVMLTMTLTMTSIGFWTHNLWNGHKFSLRFPPRGQRGLIIYFNYQLSSISIFWQFLPPLLRPKKIKLFYHQDNEGCWCGSCVSSSRWASSWVWGIPEEEISKGQIFPGLNFSIFFVHFSTHLILQYLICRVLSWKAMIWTGCKPTMQMLWSFLPTSTARWVDTNTFNVGCNNL